MLLEVNALRVSITGVAFPAVDGVSFGVKAGEITGLVGESGCGKTLTGLSIPGLLPRGAAITGGNILFKGRNLCLLSEKEMREVRGAEIGVVFQEPMSSLNPLQKIGVQIAEPLLLHGVKDKVTRRRRVLELMSALGFPEPERMMGLYPHELSGGLCQRVMIALAVIARPALLIADEPTTALDGETGARILALLKSINSELGASIIFISHDLRLVRGFCSRVLVMYAGRLVEGGPTEEVFSRPLHEYTRGLLGAIPDRRLRGRPLARIPGIVPSLEEGRPPGCPFAPRCGKALPACAARFPEAVRENSGSAGGVHAAHCLRAAAVACVAGEAP